MERIIFQYYPSTVKSNKPQGLVSLEQFVRAQREPKEHVRQVFERIRQAELDGDKKLKATLKQDNLFYFTPCVLVDGLRRYENIERFTGLAVIDFDHLDNAPDLKQFLFDEYQSVICSWLSPSRRGVKCLMRIPVAQSVKEFKEYYFGIASEMNQYAGFDPSGQNSVLPLFQSYDPELILRENYNTWTIKGVKLNDLENVTPTPPPDIEITDKDKECCIKLINAGFNNITDYGHPPLRSLCLAIGGYVATGYISEFDAIRIIDHNIENHNYLKKGIRGYKQTARWAINIGKNKSLTLKHD